MQKTLYLKKTQYFHKKLFFWRTFKAHECFLKVNSGWCMYLSFSWLTIPLCFAKWHFTSTQYTLMRRWNKCEIETMENNKKNVLIIEHQINQNTETV